MHEHGPEVGSTDRCRVAAGAQTLISGASASDRSCAKPADRGARDHQHDDHHDSGNQHLRQPKQPQPPEHAARDLASGDGAAGAEREVIARGRPLWPHLAEQHDAARHSRQRHERQSDDLHAETVERRTGRAGDQARQWARRNTCGAVAERHLEVSKASGRLILARYGSDMTNGESTSAAGPQGLVASEFDATVRAALSNAYRRAPTVLRLGMLDDARNVWNIAPGSPAEREPLIETRLFMYLAAEIDRGTNLPLSQARSLLADAAAIFKVLGLVILEHETALRFASIAPLARSIAERSSTVAWVLTADDAEKRLQRALLVEIRGLEFLIRYLPDVRVDRDASDLEHARERFLEIAEVDAGGYELDRARWVLSVGSETRPTLTSIVADSTTPSAYAELSVHSHPTGYLHVASTEWSSGGHGQVWFERKSTVHDEARLCEGALLAFSKALIAAADHIGANTRPVYEWAAGITNLWQDWCAENGCR